MADVNITYETLFDLLRRERNREELQSLDDSFFSDVVDYMLQKQSLVPDINDPSAISADVEKARIQFQNIKKILKELYDRREKKIVLLAVNSVRTSSGLVDRSVFLPEELAFFDELVTICSKYRGQVLQHVLSQVAPFGGGIPTPSPTVASPHVGPAGVERADDMQESVSRDDTSANTSPASHSDGADRSEDRSKRDASSSVTSAPEQKSPEVASRDASKKPSDGISVRFLKGVPRFAGANEQVFGPFKNGDEAVLPEKIATILIKKGRVEALN